MCVHIYIYIYICICIYIYIYICIYIIGTLHRQPWQLMMSYASPSSYHS